MYRPRRAWEVQALIDLWVGLSEAANAKWLGWAALPVSLLLPWLRLARAQASQNFPGVFFADLAIRTAYGFLRIIYVHEALLPCICVASNRGPALPGLVLPCFRGAFAFACLCFGLCFVPHPLCSHGPLTSLSGPLFERNLP